MFSYYKMENKKYLNAIFDVNKYSFNGYNDVFLPERTINCCDDDIKILLKTNEFNFYIKWLEKMMNINNNNNNIYHKKDIKEELIINTYYFEINNTNHLYYFNFDEYDECTEFILLLNTKGNFVAVGHNGGHLFIDTDKFSFCQSDGTGDQLFPENIRISKFVLLFESVCIIKNIIRNYTADY